MYNMELENRQKLWRWLIVAAIGGADCRNLAGGPARRRTSFGPGGGIADMSMSLIQALERVARRFRRERLFSSLAICWMVWALVGCAMKTRWFQETSASIDEIWLVGSLALAAMLSAVFCVIWAQSRARDPRWVARRIEAKHPELKTGLLAAVEEISGTPSGRLGFLQTAVIRQALNHRRARDWNETVPDLDAAGSDAGPCRGISFAGRRAVDHEPAGALGSR